MDKKEKKRIIQLFIEMAKAMAALLSQLEDQSLHSDAFLAGHFQEEREQILVKLLGDPIYAAKFSETYLDKMLKEKTEAMIHALRQKEAPRERSSKIATNIAEDIITTLDSYTTRLTVCFPVAGLRIQLEAEKLELGNMLFQHMTKERIDEVVDRIVSSGTRYTENEKQAWREYFNKEFQELFNDEAISVCAVYDVVAEPIRAEERARTECYLVFDLLRYALPILSNRYPMRFSMPREYLGNDQAETHTHVKRERKAERVQDSFISFGLQGEVATNVERTVIILRDPPGFSLSTDRKERFDSLEIDPQVRELLDEAKVFEASRIIKKGDASQTDFERTILRSIHWFANAQTPMLSEYVLLSLMFSIEAFLNPPGGHEEVTKAISEGVAALEGVQGYVYRKKRMERLYDKRSALSHGGHTDIMERDITELRAIAFYLIHQMLQCTDKFTTQKQLFEEVKEKRKAVEQQIARNHASKIILSPIVYFLRIKAAQIVQLFSLAHLLQKMRGSPSKTSL